MFQSGFQTSDGGEVLAGWRTDFLRRSLSGGTAIRTFANLVAEQVGSIASVFKAHPLTQIRVG